MWTFGKEEEFSFSNRFQVTAFKGRRACGGTRRWVGCLAVLKRGAEHFLAVLKRGANTEDLVCLVRGLESEFEVTEFLKLYKKWIKSECVMRIINQAYWKIAAFWTLLKLSCGFPGSAGEISVNCSKCCREIVRVLFLLEKRDGGTLEE